MVCALCDLNIGVYPVVEEGHTFCCHGCRTVFQILKVKNVESFQDHPVFLQAVQSGLISNPALPDFSRTLSMSVKLQLEIADLWCPSCAEVIRLVLMQKAGVGKVIVDYATDLALIEYSPRDISKEEIIQSIRSLGYTPLQFEDAEKRGVNSQLYYRFIVAAFCALNVMMFSYPLYATYFNFEDQGYGELFAWMSLAFSLPVVSYCSWTIYKRFWHSFRLGILGMETLVVVGVVSAFAVSIYEMWKGSTYVYFDSMTVIVAFVLLGKIIESKAKFTAKEALVGLSRSLPRRARREGVFVPIKEVLKGDLLSVYMGEKIVLDGVVEEGEGIVNESSLTGEFVPVRKKKNDVVIAGTILESGKLTYQVISTAEDSTLKRIVDLVMHDLGHKSSYVRSVDRIIRWFVPCVFALALLDYVLVGSFYNVLTVLLISCPCAIGIAAPIAEARVLNELAKRGAIVRNRGALAFLGKPALYVFDKTGTVTEGKFKVVGGLDLPKEELARIKGLAAASQHPISRAIASAIEEEAWRFDHVEEVLGAGVKSGEYLLGSKAFVGGVSTGDLTSVFFSREGRIVTEIHLEDSLKEGIPELIQSLEKTILLSGDGTKAVGEVAKRCGFKDWKGECTPLQKRDVIEELKKTQTVIMVGDGVNDAPALTAAHVGISVMTATDISIQVSDILLTTDNLNILRDIQNMSRKGHRIIQQNLFWAFFYNIVGIGLAMAGLLTPVFAAFSMTASSIIVILNAKRTLKSS